MKPRRIFLSINLPEHIKEQLLSYKNNWSELPARWTTQNNLHLTLVFLGNTSDTELQNLIKDCQRIGESHKPFDLSINHIQYGPNEHHPRMIWGTLESSSELTALQKDLSQFATEQESYLPHLTLARLRMFELQRMEREELPLIQEEPSLSFSVNSFEIMESQLKRTGAEYTFIEQCMLKR